MNSSKKLALTLLDHYRFGAERAGQFCPTGSGTAVLFHEDIQHNPAAMTFYSLRHGTTNAVGFEDAHIRTIRTSNLPWADHPGSLLLFRFDRQTGLLFDSRAVYLFERGLEAKTIIPIESRLPLNENGFYPRLGRAGTSDGNLIPVGFYYQSVGTLRQFALLEIDLERKRAAWKRQTPRWQAFFGSREPQVAHLHHHDYPRPFDSFDYPQFSDIMLKNNQLYVFCTGPNNPAYTGLSYNVLAQIDEGGNVREILFGEGSFAEMSDQKKRGKLGCFSSSQAYCILQPINNSPENWNGRTKLFDLENRVLIDIDLPRGFAKYQVIDHLEDTFWISCLDRDYRYIAACTGKWTA